jgi:hypothetical protein
MGEMRISYRNSRIVSGFKQNAGYRMFKQRAGYRMFTKNDTVHYTVLTAPTLHYTTIHSTQDKVIDPARETARLLNESAS